MPPFDVVIRNGTVVDGSGLAPYRADVGVTAGRVSRIGRIRERANEEIDAEGHVVTPGFIDGHTHMDAQVFWDPLGTSSCWHGITTVVMGNCGFTLAPARASERALVIRNLERAEDISPAALAAGIDWTWQHFDEYLEAVDAAPKALNYAAYVGHSALRTFAMGEEAFTRTARDDEVEAMAQELKRSLAAGAIGFSSSRSPNHETSDNHPVASRLASWDEFARLVGTVGANGGGVCELAQETTALSADPAERRDWHARMRALAVETGVPLTFGVSPLAPICYEILAAIDATAAAGGRMFGQTHSRGISVVLSFRTRLPFDVLPGWRALRSLPHEEQKRHLSDPETRRRLVAEAHSGDYGRPIGTEARRPDYDWIYLLDEALPPHVSVAEMAAKRGCDPVECMIDLALESNFDQMFLQPVLPYPEADVLEVMRHPRSVMTFSDSGAHVSQITDCSVQTHLLGYWVRQRGAIALEEAVRMLTLAPATAWGFSDRGLVREGMVADLNVFDPGLVAPELPVLVTDLPGGARRLIQRSTGFLATLVAGAVVWRDGEHSGALPGRLLRRRVSAA